jgi:hypothetical protein
VCGLRMFGKIIPIKYKFKNKTDKKIKQIKLLAVNIEFIGINRKVKIISLESEAFTHKELFDIILADEVFEICNGVIGCKTEGFSEAFIKPDNRAVFFDYNTRYAKNLKSLALLKIELICNSLDLIKKLLLLLNLVDVLGKSKAYDKHELSS